MGVMKMCKETNKKYTDFVLIHIFFSIILIGMSVLELAVTFFRLHITTL